MASSSNKDNSMEYDKTIYKKPAAPKKNHLAGRVNKFQEKVNQTQSPTAPTIQHIHESIFSCFFFRIYINIFFI